MATKLDIYYSKLVFRMSNSKRFGLYRKLASLLRNDFTLMDALSRLEYIESKEGRKPDEPFALAMRAWQTALERGFSFADATREWIPSDETLMLAFGDMSRLSVALENVVRVGEGVEKIKSSLLFAVAYPVFLLVLTIATIIMVGQYLVPSLMEAAGSDIIWRGVAGSLVSVSDFSNKYWPLVAGGFVIVAWLIWLSMANFTGKIRVFFDYLPPWNLYKIAVSVSWLMALSAIVSSGGNLVTAVKMLADNGTPYLRNILERTMHFVTNGDNLGVALRNSERHFPNDEIIGDLQIYADMKGFDENIARIATDYLDESVRKIGAFSDVMNSVGILLVSAIIGWVVLGTFAMQDQIVTVLA